MSLADYTVLVVGASGSIGRHAVAEALDRGYRVRALVRGRARARVLPAGAEPVVGDLAQPATLGAAVDGVDAIVFTHGSTTREMDVRDIDYAGVGNVLTALGGRRVRVALMTAVGVTRPDVAYAAWKRRAEKLVRASGNDYTIVRPGWFDYNDANQRRIVMRQGDTSRTGTPADGVIARDEIARVLIEALRNEEATRKTLELAAEAGAEQDELSSAFATLRRDAPGALDGIADRDLVLLAQEPARFRQDLAGIQSLIRNKDMSETRFEQSFPLGNGNDAFAEYFSGQSYLAQVVDGAVPVHNVTFEPGCRNNWHIHHGSSGAGDQILLCTAGSGWYQAEGEEPVSMIPGVAIRVPAGTKHWHGAKADSWFSHLAFITPGDGVSTEWLDPVSDDVYAKLPTH